MLDETRRLVELQIPRGAELAFETVVDLVADWRSDAFVDRRLANELGVAWMSCCGVPGQYQSGKSVAYRRSLVLLRLRFLRIESDPDLQRALLNGLTPRARHVEMGDRLLSIEDVFRGDDDRGRGAELRPPQPLQPGDLAPEHVLQQ